MRRIVCEKVRIVTRAWFPAMLVSLVLEDYVVAAERPSVVTRVEMISER